MVYNNVVTEKQAIAVRKVLLKLKGFNYDRSITGKRISLTHNGVKYTLYPCANRVISKGLSVITVDKFLETILGVTSDL